MGKNVQDNNRVKNLILGEESKACSADRKLQQYSQEVGRRFVSLIDSSPLLQSHLSVRQMAHTVGECVNISAPGPHVFILVLQHNDFTEKDMNRVKHVLEQFSEKAIKRTIVVTTDEQTFRSMFGSMLPFTGNVICQLINECGREYLQLGENKPEWHSKIFTMIDQKIKENSDEYLTCEIYHDVKGTSVDEEQSRSEEENQESSYHNDDGRPKERQNERSEGILKHPKIRKNK